MATIEDFAARKHETPPGSDLCSKCTSHIDRIWQNRPRRPLPCFYCHPSTPGATSYYAPIEPEAIPKPGPGVAEIVECYGPQPKPSPYPHGMTREQWLEEVAARLYLEVAGRREQTEPALAEYARNLAEVFVVGGDKRRGKEDA